MSVEARTWTLDLVPGDHVEEGSPEIPKWIHSGGVFTREEQPWVKERVEVIELEPVLDLLEVAVKARLTHAASFGEQKQLEASDLGVALLRTHGRLK